MTSLYTRELHDISVQPAAAEAVLRLAADPRSAPAQLARVVETDPALVARVLRLANSPYYGASRRVASVQHAIVMLGVDTVRGLAINATLSLLTDEVDLERVELGPVECGPEGFWRHALAAATASTAIAVRVGVPGADAYATGLLHDIGTVMLHGRDPVAYARATAPTSTSRVVAGEIAAFGVTHAQVGADALDAWGFPYPFVEAVALHQHGIEFAEHALARVVRAADAIAYGDLDDPMIRMLGVADCGPVVSAIGAHYADVMDLLGGEPPTASREALVELLETTWLLELDKIREVPARVFLQLALDALVQLYPLAGCSARLALPGCDDVEVHAGTTAAREREYPLTSGGVTFGWLSTGPLTTRIDDPDRFFEIAAARIARAVTPAS